MGEETRSRNGHETDMVTVYEGILKRLLDEITFRIRITWMT